MKTYTKNLGGWTAQIIQHEVDHCNGVLIMENVFLLGNGFDLYHKLPTKYFDFICVAKYLTSKHLFDPINVGKILFECKESKNIKDCYEAHRDTFDAINIDLEKAVEIGRLLDDNLWFNYFLKTLNIDAGWIDFEKEISTVIEHLDKTISEEGKTVQIPSKETVSAFVLNNFKYFLEVKQKSQIYAGNSCSIKKEFLKERIYNSGILVADKKKIFEELYNHLLNFSKALNIYFGCFIENALDMLCEDEYVKNHSIDLVTMADSCVTFNYTSTFEKLYNGKKVFHIHGMIKRDNIVLGVNPNKSDDINTDNTSLIKFKKYYQREFRGTDQDYVDWYRTTIGAGKEYRVVVIGHSLDETDKDILSDIFQNAKEIYVTYHNDESRDDYFKNVVRIFGESGFDTFKKKKNMKFFPLSNISDLIDTLKREEIKWAATTI